MCRYQLKGFQTVSVPFLHLPAPADAGAGKDGIVGKSSSAALIMVEYFSKCISVVESEVKETQSHRIS